MKIFLVLAASLFCFSHFASAETVRHGLDVRRGSRIHDYIYSESFRPILEKIAREFDEMLGIPCDGLYEIDTAPFPTVNQPIELPENAVHPTRGVWSLRFKSIRCGKAKILNAIFQSNGMNPVKITMGFPGDSISSIQLQIDAMKHSSVIAGAVLKASGIDCKLTAIVDTRVGKNPEWKKIKGVATITKWTENWSYISCSHRIDVPIRFVVNERGGTNFEVRSEDVRLINLRGNK